VEQLEVKDGAVQIRGQSLEASALIGLVEESKLFHSVMFLSPVTADRRTGRDRFFLSAQLSEPDLLFEEDL
jgi:general secretion pathway protein L